MRRVACIGPSKPANLKVAGSIQLLPPAKHGDIDALNLQKGDVLLLVDGLYQQCAPVRHKELLRALDSGVQVLGTASIGALRAVELESFGMRGLGRVFEGYLNDKFSDDADVALLHTEPPKCLAITRPLVSLLLGIEDLLASGNLDDDAAKDLISSCRALHFTERTSAALLSGATVTRTRHMEVLLHHVDAFDAKRTDSRNALRWLENLGAHNSERSICTDRPQRSSVYEVQDRLELMSTIAPHQSTREVLAALQIVLDDFPDRHLKYAERLADHTGSDVLANHEAVSKAPRCSGPKEPFAERSTLEFSPELQWPTVATSLWSSEDRGFARTFRLSPGNVVYAEIPHEVLEGIDPADLASLLGLLYSPSTVRLNTTDKAIHDVIASIWHAQSREQLKLAALERGFTSLAQCLNAAVGMNFQTLTALASSRPDRRSEIDPE